MIHFWDTSALVPLFINEQASKVVRLWHESCARMACWTFTSTEIYSALCRRLRERSLSPAEFDIALSLWQDIGRTALQVNNVEGVKKRAERLLRFHPLKAADALQLAAALIVTDDYPEGHDFYTLDGRLAECARKEGFSVHSV